MAENIELAIPDLPSKVQLEDHESSKVSLCVFITVGCTLHIASASLGFAEINKQPIGLCIERFAGVV